MKPIIRVENLSKQYRLGALRASYGSLRESLAGAARRPFARLRGAPRSKRQTLWALKDVSFDVLPGETVGIIGRNGAGKSTLLKILSRITEPTTGRAKLFGRVGSLLEVGTGFHPELTGRENVYLNGAILGMARREIADKFDEIVQFAEVERFLDTPVKHYSSGMYMRLAFSVAAHLESEILVVDEVLAVGDAKFQKKCLGKMSDISRQGRTVLFVSHNIGAIRMLCNKGIYLAGGEIMAMGAVDEVVAKYETSADGQAAERHWQLDESPGSERVKLSSVRVTNADAKVTDVFTRSDAIQVAMRFRVMNEAIRLNPHLHLMNRAGELLFIATNLHNPGDGQRTYAPGDYEAACVIPEKLLNVGVHFVTLYLIKDLNHHEVRVDGAVSFEVVEDGIDRGDYLGGWAGYVRPVLDWRVRAVNS